ncbi:MAG: hypothetical protein KY463_01085 [Actinobacteria bacterium]|nr:hypothetical protein [Actinomycetota bacterium]
MGSKFATTSRLAAEQQGRVAWRQLVDLGVDRHLIQRWLEDGRLHPVYRGVYTVGHTAPSLRGSYMAAVLAGGLGAVLSHRADGYLLKILRGAPPPPEITVPTTAHRRRPGFVIHRVRALHPRDVAILDGIPITTVPRVLLDLAPSLKPTDLTRACHEAWVHHPRDPGDDRGLHRAQPAQEGGGEAPSGARLRRDPQRS